MIVQASALAPETPQQQLRGALAQIDAGQQAAGVAALERLREACDADDPLRPRLMLALAGAYPRLGRSSDAVRAGIEALLLYDQPETADGRCDAHIALALAYSQVGVGREALEHALQALELARALHDGAREAWALARAGNAHGAMENPVQARETTQQARELAERLGLAELELVCLNNLAYFTLDECDRLRFDGMDAQLPTVQAMGQLYAEQALERARSAGNPYLLAMALSNANEAQLRAGESDLAAPRIDELAQMAAQHGFSAVQRFARLQRALLATTRGQWSTGVSIARQLIEDEGEQLQPRQRRAALQLLYEAHKALGDPATALAYLEQLMQIERRAMREAQLLHTQLLMIRQEVHHAVRRAEYAAADADAAREQTRALQHEQQHLRELLASSDRAAREDALTGLANRRHAEQVLQLLTERAASDGQPIALAILDLDHFKQVNDRFGHDIGDAVLRRLAGLLQQQLRGADVLARWGGEEFLLALSDTPADACLSLLERLRKAVHDADWAELAPGLAVTVSIGCRHRHPQGDWTAQLREADAALYAAKHAGRDRVVLKR